MPSPPDRPVHILEQDYPSLPLPPLNFTVQSGLEKGVIDLHWDLPSNLIQNSRFSIVGVNIYRSFDSEFGPFHRLNDIPVGSTYWRDRNQVQLVLEEDVSNSFFERGYEDPDGQYAFHTAHHPIVIQPWLGIADLSSVNMVVTVNGVQASISKLMSETGEVYLETMNTFDTASQTKIPPVLPTSDNDVVLATYRYLENEVRTDLGHNIFYRITTVAQDNESGQLIETSLDNGASSSNRHIEPLDWIWRESIRRNRFLLIQGGERVKVFIKKTAGFKCGCYSSLHKQPTGDCEVCWGTGYIGGYDGPYDIIMAPDDAQKAIAQGNRGRTVSHPYDTWTGPSPLLSQRDFIIKLDGDRYAIGPVRRPTSRGMILQQFFTLSHIDETDIRYRVPVMNTRTLLSPQTRYSVSGQAQSTPMFTERQAIPDEREFRGSTVAYENTYRR